MKLDATVMRTMQKSEFRVMEAVEQGMQSHYIVPMNIISAIGAFRHSGVHKIISSLLRDKLLSHERKGGMDGYRLTNSGYDVLALYHLKIRGIIVALGHKIGTGKESDIYLAATPTGRQICLKFHRLGRTSFRNVKQKRDYGRTPHSTAHSWLFLSRMSATKEYAFMSALHKHGYNTPEPIAQNRHIIAMSLVRGTPLYQIYPKQVNSFQAESIYRQAIAIAARLAKSHGLVHCDLNEFNLLVDLSGIQQLATDDTHDAYVRHSGHSIVSGSAVTVGTLSKPAWEQTLLELQQEATTEALPEPLERLENGDPKPVVTLIDFPQMISTVHPNAQELYERDMACLKRFFEMKLKCEVPEAVADAIWENVVDDDERILRLDQELNASGVSLHDNQQLELYYYESGLQPIASAIIAEEEDDDSSSSSDEEGDDSPPQQNIQRDVEDLSNVVIDTSEAGGLNESKQKDADDVSTIAENNSAALSIRTLSREELQVIAKDRVQKQMNEQKRKARMRGAYRKPNSNKSYEKGKRVVKESLM